MARKFKVKGKTYTLLEEMNVIDKSIIKRRAKVADSKGVVFTYMHSVTGHHLYNDKDQRIVETSSVQEWES